MFRCTSLRIDVNALDERAISIKQKILMKCLIYCIIAQFYLYINCLYTSSDLSSPIRSCMEIYK